jgi:hypothetical protein
MKYLKIKIIIISVILLSCSMGRQKEQSEKKSKEKIDSVIIKYVDALIFTFSDIDCDEFENAFKEDSDYKVLLIQNCILIDSL